LFKGPASSATRKLHSSELLEPTKVGANCEMLHDLPLQQAKVVNVLDLKPPTVRLESKFL